MEGRRERNRCAFSFDAISIFINDNKKRRLAVVQNLHRVNALRHRIVHARVFSLCFVAHRIQTLKTVIIPSICDNLRETFEFFPRKFGINLMQRTKEDRKLRNYRAQSEHSDLPKSCWEGDHLIAAKEPSKIRVTSGCF